MGTVSKFISHNLAGTNWQAQVVAVKRKFIIYVNSFCAICTLSSKNDIPERGRGRGEREGDGSFISAKLCEVFFTSCWRQSAFVTIKQRLKLWNDTPGRGVKRERGILSCCKYNPVSPPVSTTRLPLSASLARWRRRRHGAPGTFLFASHSLPAGVHLSWTRLSLYSTLFFGTDFPGPSGQSIMTATSTLLAVTVSFTVSSVLPWNMQSAVKKLFICINQTEFFHSFFQFLTFSGGTVGRGRGLTA